MKIKIKLSLISIMMVTLLACNANTDKPSSTNTESEHVSVIESPIDEAIATPTLPTPEPTILAPTTPEPTILETTPVDPTPEPTTTIVPITEREPLKENEFYPDLIKVGDQVAGLTVESIEYDILDIPSYIIKFRGEVILEGEVKHLNSDERTVEIYPVYFTVSEDSLFNLPRKKSTDMNYPEVIGILNGLEVLEHPGKKTVSAKFHNLTLNISPTKPVNHTFELVEVLE